MQQKDIIIDGKTIKALCLPLHSKNLIALIGSKGYVMCGYLDMSVADKFNDPAVKITGVSSIDDCLLAKASAVSKKAAELGIVIGQPIREILSIIA